MNFKIFIGKSYLFSLTIAPVVDEIKTRSDIGKIIIIDEPIKPDAQKMYSFFMNELLRTPRYCRSISSGYSSCTELKYAIDIVCEYSAGIFSYEMEDEPKVKGIFVEPKWGLS